MSLASATYLTRQLPESHVTGKRMLSNKHIEKTATITVALLLLIESPLVVTFSVIRYPLPML